MLSPKFQPPLKFERFNGSILQGGISRAGALIRWAIKWVDGAHDVDLDAAAEALAAAKQLRRTAAHLEKALEEAMIAEMFHTGEATYRGRDFAAVLRPGTDRSQWKNAEVMEALIESTFARFQKRFPGFPPGILRAVIAESMWEVHKRGRIEWRSTDLREAGIDPDDFSVRSIEKPTIEMRGAGTYYPGAKTRGNNRKG